MNQSILSMGSTRSQEINDYNKQVDLRNKNISEQINKLKKQGKPDTSMNDLQYAFKDGVLGLTGSKSIKDLGKKLTSTTKPQELQSVQTVEPVENNTRGDLVKFDSAEEGPSLYKMPSEVQPTGTADDPIPAEPVSVQAEAPQELESAGKAASKDAGEFGLAELGEAAGIAEGADAISKDVEGKWKTFNTAQKVGNVADIVGAAADSAAVAVPFLAPVAAGIGAVSDVIGSIADEIGTDQAARAKATLEKSKQIQTLQSQRLKYKSTPVYSQIGLMASPLKSNSKITGSYGF